ncbi:mechanosensitive ion channel domain-containing protein [Pelagicoccus sp. SDUM812005]|uniref:mechanosensitive ion channel family protein n=1 Tax=Pelagicoccus sp. SDUM812005 TaxID=3041257 RepID=UPI00280ECADE|nr:mechanosensitive ion channel domain-containing protein [Pelagicoccus sp. SDUM812005]MDQ8179917.1 mechanosensitive ion channel [Pelagicoccus sp. SDUM812005]
MFDLFTPLLLQAESSKSATWSEMAEQWIVSAWESFRGLLVGEDLYIQLGAIAGVAALAYVLHFALKPLFRKVTEAIEERDDWVESAIDWVSDNFFRIALASLLWSVSIYFDGRNEQLAVVAALESGQPAAAVMAEGQVAAEKAVEAKNYILLRAAASLATLILLSGALPRPIRTRAYFKTLYFVTAVLLVLNLLGVWEVIRDGLDSLQVLPVAEGESTRVTALTIGKGIFVILILIPLTGWVMRLGEGRVKKSPALTPALQMLVIKVLKAMVVVGAILFGISSMGIDLSALAFMGGAVGLGLGFGFQKVVSNLISGVILLSDRSIKPGDVIEVDNTYGWINKLSARYVSVITRDGMEHLIPNETLITEKVTNWSFSDDLVRVRVPFGVSYHADGKKVMELANRAAAECKRVVRDKPPSCWLLNFGDSSVNFELRVWIRDPANGLGSIRSEIYMRLWELFKENDIEIPFPQRDINLRGGKPIEVVMKQPDAKPEETAEAKPQES